MSGGPRTGVGAEVFDDFGAPSDHRAARALLNFGKTKPLGCFCGLLLIVIVVVAVFAGQIAPYHPNQNSTDLLLGPAPSHLLGTDNFGRDVMSRVIYGARTAMEVAAISTGVAIVIWLLLGVSGAYFGGIWDYATGRLVDFIQALPGIVLLIALLAVVGRSVPAIGVVLGIAVGIVGSRVVRGATFIVAAQQYVEAARAIGCPTWRVFVRYLFPNVMPIVIVLATINVGTSIIAAASLSFLGYGVQPPTSDWGAMLSSQGRAYMIGAPWLFYAPVAALALVVFSVNMFGDALRDKLDPRLRGG